LEKIYWGEVFFLKKIEDFFQKTTSPLKILFARLSSVARNSALSSVKVIFRHKKVQIFFVRKFGMIHVFIVFFKSLQQRLNALNVRGFANLARLAAIISATATAHIGQTRLENAF
jgi:hypothetical protein